MMTRKARALGMSRTVYANASGLPDDDQLTTARDQATLGRAIQDRFPRYYRYFATPAFVYHGRAMRNHNKLLGRVEGVDGIKTGYTRASGFNLVSSVRRGNRHIVAVVLGGSSGGARDARMRTLIEQHIASASAQRTVAKIAEATDVAAASREGGKARAAGAASHAPHAMAPRSRAHARADAMATVAALPRIETAWPPRNRSRRCHRARRHIAQARLRRADQPRQSENHHGEGRQRADRDAGAARRLRPAGECRAGAFRREPPSRRDARTAPPPGRASRLSRSRARAG